MDAFRQSLGSDDAGQDILGTIDPVDCESNSPTRHASIQGDERRMQVRVYNFWAGLLQDQKYPSIEELAPEDMDDFGPHSVLLDFTGGIENPGIAYVGETLARECGVDQEITRLEEVPPRSLLSRITDHYMQILANEAPIGFEAEFVNHREKTILYRGILLPFSSDNQTIDFIYGVVNWKVVEGDAPGLQHRAEEASLQSSPLDVLAFDGEGDDVNQSNAPGRPSGFAHNPDHGQPEHAPEALFGRRSTVPHSEPGKRPLHIDDGENQSANAPAPTTTPYAEAETAAPATAGLYDLLAQARELAHEAGIAENRSRQALYQALCTAYSFADSARTAPSELMKILQDAGLTPQARAPMTPIIKLVFGIDYDKKRITEYATVLAHAQRIGVNSGELADHLSSAPGGLKALVAAERRARRQDKGEVPSKKPGLGAALASKLSALKPRKFETLSTKGDEFALVLVRRTNSGEVLLLDEVPKDDGLLKRAAQKMFAAQNRDHAQ